MKTIKNTRTKRILSKKPKLLTTHAQHAQGLMFSKRKEDFGLIFQMHSEQKIPIHMIFVFYAIDVLWLNKNRKVIDCKANIKPFSPYIVHKGFAQYLVEVPAGTIKRTQTKIGDNLEWE